MGCLEKERIDNNNSSEEGAPSLQHVQTTMTTFSSVFLSGEALSRLITYMCNTRPPGAWDPITSTILDILSGRLQWALSSEGLIPFKGKGSMVYPFHMMSPEQKEFIRSSMEHRELYSVQNNSIVFHSNPGEREFLDPVPVLASMCRSVLASGIHEDSRIKVGVCNILLQRVQNSITITKAVQQELNALLFQ